MPQPIAEPVVGTVAAASVGTCAGCGKRITRLLTESGQWRHDNDAIPCGPRAGVFSPRGPIDGGLPRRDAPSFDDLVKGGRR